MTVRSADRGDLRWIAAIHRRQLPHGFFARLGSRYLRAYHRSFMQSPHAVALVAERRGRRVGFVVGVVDPVAHHRYVVRQHGLRLAVVGAMSLVARPALALEFLRTRVVRYLRSVSRATSPRRTSDAPGGAAPETTAAVLTHVAVDPEAQGAGAGRFLVEAFVDEVREAGAAAVELVTLSGERGAASFYEKLGWKRAGATERGGASFTHFVLEP